MMRLDQNRVAEIISGRVLPTEWEATCMTCEEIMVHVDHEVGQVVVLVDNQLAASELERQLFEQTDRIVLRTYNRFQIDQTAVEVRIGREVVEAMNWIMDSAIGPVGLVDGRLIDRSLPPHLTMSIGLPTQQFRGI